MMKKSGSASGKKGGEDVSLAKLTEKMKKSTSVMRDELVFSVYNFIGN